MEKINIYSFYKDLEDYETKKIKPEEIITKYIKEADLDSYTNYSAEELKNIGKNLALIITNNEYNPSFDDVIFLENLYYYIIADAESELDKSINKQDNNNIFYFDIKQKKYQVSVQNIRKNEFNFFRILSHVYCRLGYCEQKLSYMYIADDTNNLNITYESNQNAIEYAETSIFLDEDILDIQNKLFLNDKQKEYQKKLNLEQYYKDKIHLAIVHKDIVLHYCLNQINFYLKLNKKILNNDENSIAMLKNNNLKKKDVHNRISKYLELICTHLKSSVKHSDEIDYKPTKDFFDKIDNKLYTAGFNIEKYRSILNNYIFTFSRL